MATVVRPAVVADAAGITEVHVRAWQVAYRGIFPDSFLDDFDSQMDERRRRWETIIVAPDHAGTVTLVTDDGVGRITGWASHGPSRDSDVTLPTGEIYGIYVHPGHWRAGDGTELMTACVEQMAAARLPEATLWVLEDNKAARRFYERRGWRPDGATDWFERGAARAVEVRYRRPLT